MSNPEPTPPISFHFRIIQHKDDPAGGRGPQKIGVDSTGKEVKDADWDALGAYVNEDWSPMTKKQLIAMIPTYEMKAYGTPKSETSKPRDIWIYDHEDLTDPNAEEKTSPYQKYNWQPVSISIEPNERKKNEKWKTKKQVLTIDEEQAEECCLWDPRVDEAKPKIVSEFYCSGNPIFGEDFAPPITFEFRGFTEALGLCCLTPDARTTQKRTIKWVLHQFGDVSEDDHCVYAIKHTIHAKLKYEVRVSGVAAGDVRESKKSNMKYRQFPVDFILEHNDIKPITEMFEEVELVYYTHIEVIEIE